MDTKWTIKVNLSCLILKQFQEDWYPLHTSNSFWQTLFQYIKLMVADKPISLKFPFLQGIDCLAISNQLFVLFLKS